MGPPPKEGQRPRLRLLPPFTDGPSAPAHQDGPSRAGGGDRLAEEVAALLAETTSEVLAGAPLALPLALSVCMERHGVGADGMVDAMRLLRRGLLQMAGPGAHQAPVPLAVGDPRGAALELAAHLLDLFARAAIEIGGDRRAVASSALQTMAAS